MKTTIKNTSLLIIVLMFSSTFFGQAVFDKFDGQEDVTSVIVNKKMFQMMGNVKLDTKEKDTQAYINLVKKLDNLKVFTTSSSRTTIDMKAAADKYIKTAGLEELMRVNNAGKNIKILVKSGSTESQIKELLMFIEGSGKGNDTVLMFLTGNFDLNEISVLTDKMRIPGGDELKNATKNKK
jgi:hypothetical protein